MFRCWACEGDNNFSPSCSHPPVTLQTPSDIVLAEQEAGGPGRWALLEPHCHLYLFPPAPLDASFQRKLPPPDRHWKPSSSFHSSISLSKQRCLLQAGSSSSVLSLEETCLHATPCWMYWEFSILGIFKWDLWCFICDAAQWSGSFRDRRFI